MPKKYNTKIFESTLGIEYYVKQVSRKVLGWQGMANSKGVLVLMFCEKKKSYEFFTGCFHSGKKIFQKVNG